ncbi:MAG: transglycosylase domain-containing protein [Sandaracinaceae bacterium]|nr:transglycosylase domain-containing protein [Sandaracinaceae bacterium]
MRPRLRPVIRVLSRALALAAAVGALALAALVATTDLERERFARPPDAITVTDRHGVPLRHHRPDGHDRRWVALRDVSPHLVDAVLAVEDDRFREHAGLDARASARAALSLLLPGRRASGGSTLTQQLVKLVYGRPDGLLDKPREVVRAMLLERRFGKDWILEQYLNRLPFGDRIEGVGRASEQYFGVPVAELDVAQAALLAGIPQAPSALEPRRHYAAAVRRQRVVLSRMRATGRLDEASYRAARAEVVVIRDRPVRPWRAARAADRALEEHRRGAARATRGVLPTSLDLALTEEAERILRAAVREHAARGVTNAAAVAVSNADGSILAYVGAAEQGAHAEGGWLDLARARRQPGSTLKPFVYALLFERGGTPATLLDDLSRPMVGGDGSLFVARDYDGRERGPVRAREALSASLNLAALDAARRVGAERVVDRLAALGITRLEGADRYGAAIVLGGADVSVLELAGAYAALARGGQQVFPSLVGSSLVEASRIGSSRSSSVIDPHAAALVTDVLVDRSARREAFGDDLAAERSEPFALKTGTSSGWRDAWAAVYDDSVTVVVWLGDPAGRPLRGLSGFEGAARPAARILAATQARLESLGIERRPRPRVELARARVCARTGALAGPRCTHTLEERFAPGTSPSHVCDAHRADGAVELSSRYARWLAEAQAPGFALGTATAPVGRPRIAYPRPGARLLAPPGTQLPLRATVGAETVQARWEVDGAALPSERWDATAGEHVLVAWVGEAASDPVTVRVEAAP